MNISLTAVQKITSPNPFALISACKPDCGTNLMAVSWWMYVSNHPPMVAVCLSQRSYTNELIQAAKEFALNIVDSSLQEAAFACGTCSGRTEDKAAKFHIPLKVATAIAGSVVAGSAATLECRLLQSIPAGDHTIFLAEVVHADADPTRRPLFAMDGYRALSAL